MRKFIAETCIEFYDWVCDNQNVPVNTRNDKSQYFNAFVNEYKDFQKWLTRKKFNIWVQKYCNFIDAEYLSGNSNGLQWFTIKTDSNYESTNDDNDIEF